MQKKREICDYRDKLDKTLSSPELTNHETLKSLLRNQLCSSSSQDCNEDMLDKRTVDVSKLLSKLRSVSMKDHQVSNSTSDWKLKHDLEDCRVMYREGLEGSPFHTLLVEGYMDGPIQDCLCVSWESTLYKKWWPQYTFPPFRILQSICLQKIGIGEQICLARMKVPWPLADREIIVRYFFFEYFKDGLIIILLNSISDLDSIGVSGLHESADAVRIDLVGGFVLQKVTPQRSYFRTIADMDIKLDFLPPSLINFISRQLIGNGFRLYKKSVASVAKSDEDYSKALTDPLYTKIHQALYSTKKEIEEEEEEPKFETNEVNVGSLSENRLENEPDHCRRAVPEIVEEVDEEEECFEESVSLENENVVSKSHVDTRRRFCISPEVEQALGTLERVIDMVRNRTPARETEELSSNGAKEVSLLENIESVLPQRSQRQDVSPSMEKQDKETGQENGKNSSLRKKRKGGCFAFRSWL